VVTTPSVALAARVGDPNPTANIAITNSSPDIFTEGLSVTRGATAAGFTSSGSITNLAAQGSSSAIQVALNTGTAGAFSGTQALDYVSTGTGTTTAPDISVGTGNVSLSGKVYTPAVGQIASTTLDFGIVHKGDAVTPQALTVKNSAAVTALNDVLTGSFGGATGPFTAGGSLGAGLAAQQTDGSSLTASLNTANAGVFNSAAFVQMQSHNNDMTDLGLGNVPIDLKAQVNNYALSEFLLKNGAGSFTRSGSTFYLNYGSLHKGTGVFSTTLLAANGAAGPADLLDGQFAFLDTPDFGEWGFNPFTNLAAGGQTGPLTLSFDTSTLGTYSDTIVLHGIGHNQSGYTAAIGDITLVVQGSVIPGGQTVPEPATWLLLLAGLGSLAMVRRRRGMNP
jgi:hypothetical protein